VRKCPRRAYCYLGASVRCWDTRFGRWVRRYGPTRLGRDVGGGLYGAPLTRMAVYRWVYGSTAPRLDHALRIVTLSQGQVTLADICRQRAHATPGPPP
jgi:hypothetical protein